MSQRNLVEEIEKYKGWKKGRKWIAGKLNITPEDVDKLMDKIDSEEEEIVDGVPRIVSEEIAIETGEKVVRFSSDKPLNKEEIEELYGIDGITSRLSSYWNKQQGSGKYLVSANIKCLIADFYTEDQIKDKLKELFPSKIQAYTLPECMSPSQKMLTIVISDDHAGMVNTTNLYKNEEFTESVYKKRLLHIVSEAVKLGTFEVVRVISLGDQMQGWNKQTTRGGHEVNAVSNRAQFDFFVRARTVFYDALFSSGIASEYFVDEIDTSNHAGLGFSYMANQFLSMYLTAKFPQVVVNQYDSAIDGIQWGNHVIVMTHGKEEKFQRAPFPYNIDQKTDLLIYDWVCTFGVNPTEAWVSLYKGDLHKFGVQMGKFGRYVNAPSVSGRSDYSDHNFGNSRPGAILEVFEKDSESILTKPIWF